MRYIIDTDDLLESIKKVPAEERGTYYRQAFLNLHQGKGNYPWVTKIKSVTSKKVDYSEQFESFWAKYPKKVGKGGAYKAWLKCKLPQDELLSLCLDALSWQTKQDQWIKDEGQFVPNPQTYLNQNRWEDECPPDLDPTKKVEYITNIDGVRVRK